MPLMRPSLDHASSPVNQLKNAHESFFIRRLACRVLQSLFGADPNRRTRVVRRVNDGSDAVNSSRRPRCRHLPARAHRLKRLVSSEPAARPERVRQSLLLRASSIDVDARLTPLDPPSKPAAPPNSVRRATGGAGLRHDRIPQERSCLRAQGARAPWRQLDRQPSGDPTARSRRSLMGGLEGEAARAQT
jgi:hypothetical protein